jgi:4-hydroxy-tetrahydrodipicolinate reductase
MNSISSKGTSPLRIAIVGASGRMGRVLIESVLNTPNTVLAAAVDQADSGFLGQDAGLFCGIKTGILIQTDLNSALAVSDILIDFTRPEGTLRHIQACQAHKVGLIIGTTGFSAAEKALITQASLTLPIVFAANYSVGVTLSLCLLEMAARVLNTGYDIEITEAHHRNKIDAPSGTALAMGEAVAKALGKNLKDVAVYSREGDTGIRDAQSIGFSTVRGGDIVGDHTVLFAGIGERLEITHKASSRNTFAQGAIRASLWLAQQKSGLFDMQDVLNLKNPPMQ